MVSQARSENDTSGGILTENRGPNCPPARLGALLVMLQFVVEPNKRHGAHGEKPVGSRPLRCGTFYFSSLMVLLVIKGTMKKGGLLLT
jgi:hypothetical protein